MMFCYNFASMKTIVKNLCRERNMTLKDLAAKMNIARESLSRALDGNPQLNTLQSIATALNVPVGALFASTGSLNGFVEYDGTIYRIHTPEDLRRLLDMSQR
jgi:transcriptional regulator with XRE-family HTH domain